MLAKLAAARAHDVEFVEAALVEGLVTVDELDRGIPMMRPSARAPVKELLDGLAAKVSRTG